MPSNDNQGAVYTGGANSGLPTLEAVARDVLSVRLGRTLTDTEWAGLSYHLFQFARMMSAWAVGASSDERSDWSSEQLQVA